LFNLVQIVASAAACPENVKRGVSARWVRNTFEHLEKVPESPLVLVADLRSVVKEDRFSTTSS
jgi:hypothetical protein